MKTFSGNSSEPIINPWCSNAHVLIKRIDGVLFSNTISLGKMGQSCSRGTVVKL